MSGAVPGLVVDLFAGGGGASLGLEAALGRPVEWVRGERCPKFDEQHPTAFAAALAKTREAATP